MFYTSQTFFCLNFGKKSLKRKNKKSTTNKTDAFWLFAKNEKQIQKNVLLIFKFMYVFT